MDRRSAYSRRSSSTSSFERATVRPSGEAQQPQQQRLLGMHPVLRLIPDPGVRAVDHLVGYLLTAMGRKAMQDKDVILRLADELLVQLIDGEHKRSFVCLFLLAHARPDVRIQDVGAGRRLSRVVDQLDRPTGLAG